MLSKEIGPIGVFDSGFGGLTILRQFSKSLPEYSYIYLGDNARAPYGNRSYDTVYQYTLQAVKWLFYQGCNLVILACNTASAKALRTIQQNDLPKIDTKRRVLGVIRPSAEVVGQLTKTNHVGILGTVGTVVSESYPLEIKKLFNNIHTYQHACPMWVPLIENNEYANIGAEYFYKKDIKKILEKSELIDTIILGCTHYPLIIDALKKIVPSKIKLVSQDKIVATSLKDYLQRHPEINAKCKKDGIIKFYTTDDSSIFDVRSKIFFGKNISSSKIIL